MTEPIELAAHGEEFTRNPHPLYAAMRARGPVHRVRTEEGEQWLVVGHEAARDALTDERFVKDWHSVWPQGHSHSALDAHMLQADPPRHTRLRRLVAREFTARRVAALEPRVRELTDGLLEETLGAPGRRADLVTSLAFPLPMGVICELLGVPELDRGAFRAWSAEAVSPSGPEAEGEALRAMEAYLGELVEDKRCSAPGEDLLGALIRTRAEDGAALSHEELVGMAFLLLVAGHETTVNLVSGSVLALLTHPDQLAAVRADPGLVEGAVEETLRWEGPVETSTYRFTLEDVEFRGAVIPGGAVVRVVLTSAGRDPERFPDPDVFDVRRAPQGHLAFGHGIHFCLGAPLARLEARIALGSLLERCPDLALDADPDALRWRRGLLIRGVESLPVRW